MRTTFPFDSKCIRKKQKPEFNRYTFTISIYDKRSSMSIIHCKVYYSTLLEKLKLPKCVLNGKIIFYISITESMMKICLLLLFYVIANLN